MDAALEIFAQRGFQAATMDEIAASAGFTKPILYQHFSSKEALYSEIVSETGQRLFTALESAMVSATSHRERVEAAFQVYFTTVVNETAAYRLLFLQADAGPERAELRVVESRLTTFIEQFIDSDLSVTRRRQVAAAIVGMAEGASTAWLIQQEMNGWPGISPDEIQSMAREIAQLAWSGLRSFEN